MTRITAALAAAATAACSSEQRAVRDQDHERDQPDGDGHDAAAGIGQVRDGEDRRDGGERERARRRVIGACALSPSASTAVIAVNAATPFQ